MILITLTDGTTRLCREVKFCWEKSIFHEFDYDFDYVLTDEGTKITTRRIHKIEETL